MKQSPRRATAAVPFAAGAELEENRDGRKPENRKTVTETVTASHFQPVRELLNLRCLAPRRVVPGASS
jgi:hypothetical protein